MTSATRTVRRASMALASCVVLMAGCANDASGQPTAGATDIVTNLDVPWGVAFLPDGSALIAERSGSVKQLTEPGSVTDVGGVAGVAARGEGGLLGLANAGNTVFAYLTTGADNRVVRMDFDGAALSGQSPILTGIPAGNTHNGGRIAFGPDGTLYIATGDSGNRELAQDRSSLGGKILRINADGSVPGDNPDPASPVWSYGHRNVQGLAWDGQGRLWASEYGANRVDELNLIEPGGNYGWPQAEGVAGIPGFIDPVLEWPTNESSPSGLAFYGGALWMANLRGQSLFRIPVAGDGTVGQQATLFGGQYGRLRTVEPAPDGSLWFTTSNRDGRGSPRDGDDRVLGYRE